MRVASMVLDQGVMTDPTGQSGAASFVPRLEAWVAILDLFGVPSDQKLDLISLLRYVFDLFHERDAEPGVHRLDPDTMRPLED